MIQLYPPERHQTLLATSWDPDAVQTAIEAIVDETLAAASPRGLWPVHPKDGETGSPPRADLYMGAAGVIWALDHLARQGAVEAGPSMAHHLPAMRERAHAHLLARGLQTRSYLIADAGLLLAEWRLAPSRSLEEALAEVIAANHDDPTLELMWGSPGTMLAALSLHRATGEARWADLFRAGAAALEQTFVFQPEIKAQIWTQDLYGDQRQHFGLVHGFAGVAFVLIQGRDLLHPEAWARWSPRLAQTLAATATHGEAGVTWTAGIGPSRPGRIAPVQLCHGAPGMIVGLSDLAEPIDGLLLGGG